MPRKGIINSKNAFAKDPLLKKLGDKIKFYREKKGLSKDEFAREAEIGKYFLYRIEYGNANPSILTLKKIADYLGIDIKKLLD